MLLVLLWMYAEIPLIPPPEGKIVKFETSELGHFLYTREGKKPITIPLPA